MNKFIDTKSEIKEKNYIYILKALALISIMSSHCTSVPINSSELNKTASMALLSVGRIGVGIFFVISGYLFTFTMERSGGISKFLKKKLINIVLQWLFCASLVYVYVAIRSSFSFIEWLKFIVGYNTPYWYLSVLFVLYIVYYFLYKNKVFLAFSVLISFISSITVGLNIIPISYLSSFFNPLNWTIFFTLGIFVRKISLQRTVKCCNRLKYVTVPLIALILSYLTFSKTVYAYYLPYYIPTEILAIAAFAGVATVLQKSTRISGLLVNVGKMSFSIYLLHLCGFSGVVTYLMNKFDIWWIMLLRPLIILVATYFTLYIGLQIASFLKIKKVYCMLIGTK